MQGYRGTEVSGYSTGMFRPALRRCGAVRQRVSIEWSMYATNYMYIHNLLSRYPLEWIGISSCFAALPFVILWSLWNRYRTFDGEGDGRGLREMVIDFLRFLFVGKVWYGMVW